MLDEIYEHDLDTLRQVIDEAVRGSVVASDEETEHLFEDINQSLERWVAFGRLGFHRTYTTPDDIAGFIVVKDYWNLSHLFVRPEFQGRGMGRTLVEAAVQGCRGKSPRNTIQLNSSTLAAGFYERMGFRQTGSAVDRPGGCIPYECVL